MGVVYKGRKTKKDDYSSGSNLKWMVKFQSSTERKNTGHGYFARQGAKAQGGKWRMMNGE